MNNHTEFRREDPNAEDNVNKHFFLKKDAWLSFPFYIDRKYAIPISMATLTCSIWGHVAPWITVAFRVNDDLPGFCTSDNNMTMI